MTQAIYLDYQATTPLDERVLSSMMPFFQEKFGNPHSSTHAYGWETEAAIELARENIATLIGAGHDEIIFLSGATEANNLAIKGVMEAWGQKKPHLVTVATEHKCVLEAAKYCAAKGLELTVLPVKPNGLIDLDQLRGSLTDKTALVSVMAVNNEIGVIQPIAEIGRIAHAKGVLFHCDAAQAFGKIPLDVNSMNIDFMSISGHKIYGPKGIGALYKRNGRQTALIPQMSGGGQEYGYRSGTVAPALAVGLGKAADIASDEMVQEIGRTATKMGRFKDMLFNALPGLILNGDALARWQGNLNLTFPGIDGSILLSSIRGIALSSGAACASAVSGPSYVLQAIGKTEAEAQSSLRIGIGRFTTRIELDRAADIIIKAVHEAGGIRL
ncbi:cysteine desulfurase family protein [Kordiimonas pumila]|uniref:Cysteine desulfurase n=1 Tax=Kordiimonas pumila TaxID=2161677 RepID=A0ABV7D220_9PROT|nr:aminotransferase class V-fold PLP-dependent enzyme [Kordiimonas pumila]